MLNTFLNSLPKDHGSPHRIRAVWVFLSLVMLFLTLKNACFFEEHRFLSILIIDHEALIVAVATVSGFMKPWYVDYH